MKRTGGRKAPPPAGRKPSGRNVSEAERGTVQAKFRLPPEVAERIEELADEWGITKSGAIARLVEEHDARYEE